MEFRDLRKQYMHHKKEIDCRIQEVLYDTNFIQGKQVKELEETLAEYVGVKHCITCGNGTDALQLALMAWNIGPGDAVYVPDFTFFSSGEVVSALGAIPIFVDVDEDTYNMSASSLERMIQRTLNEGKVIPKVIIAVDLFGQPAEYESIRKIAKKYELYVLEDAAQGFGGAINEVKAGAFGDIATTSFFPAKPLGCYGDGGAIFTNNDEWAELLQSLRVHGKGTSKYDNVRIGMNSRLDTLQAAVLLAKIEPFKNAELQACNVLAQYYTECLMNYVKTPVVKKDFYSSWAQYTIQLSCEKQRDELQAYLKAKNIPSMIYYQKPMHMQKAFEKYSYREENYSNTNRLCTTVLSLPFHPYLEKKEAEEVVCSIKEYLQDVQ